MAFKSESSIFSVIAGWIVFAVKGTEHSYVRSILTYGLSNN